MKKALIIILTALVVLSVFVACSGEAEDLFGKKITFNGNGSTSGRMADMKVKKGEEVTLPANAFEKTEHVFAGWNTKADGSGTGYADKARASFEDSTVLYAQWADELTITFNANDGSETPATKTQKVGRGVETALDPNTFELSGFTFTKWNTMKDGSGTDYTDGAVKTFDSDLELYAQWSANTDTPYVVNHYTKDLTGDKYTLSSTDNNTDTTGVLLTLANLKETIEGFTYSEGFAGTETKGTTKPSSGAVTEAEVLGEGNLVIDLYYSRDSHTVTLTKGSEADHISAIAGAGTYAYGASVSVEATIDSGYKLANWIVTGETTEVSTDNPYVFTMGASDVAYTANATPISYNVAFNKNNESATGTMESQSFTYGTAQNLTENGFQYEGKYFGGWATTTSGEKAYSDKQSVNNLTTTDGDTVTLYAIWTDTPPITIIKNTEGTLTLTSGDYTIEDATVTVTGRITIDGSVNLLLPDGKTLNANSGITVSSGNTLVIDKFDSESTGTGTLIAGGVGTTSANAAGIGGDRFESGGTVTINGGTVTATGKSGGAGIGGGYEGVGGAVTINGGKVTANGSEYGAGIGGGNGRAGGTVTIKGGTVTATGGSQAAGIGGGIGCGGGTISISGGDVEATGGVFAAGIGGGQSGAGGNVTITGGTVTATGGTADTGYSVAAGIGAGSVYGSSPSHGTLTIGTGYVLTGGSASVDTVLLGPVDAETTYTGAHPRYMNVSTVSEIKDSTSAITLKSGVYTTDKTDNEVVVSERITIEGSVFLLLPDGKTLTASKGITVSSGNTLVIDKYGSSATGTGTLIAGGAGTTSQSVAGIGGGGYDQAGGTIINNGGTVIATGGEYAAGIGGGEHGNGGTVTINRGTVEAHGGSGAAGIGGGGSGGDGGTVTINGGAVEAYGGLGAAGIGGGGAGDGDGGTVTINGGTVEAYGGSNAAGIGGGFFGAGADVNITGGTVNANGGSYGENYGFAIGKGYDVGSKSQGSLSVTGSNLKVYGDNSTNPPTTERTDYGTTRYRYMDVK